MEILIVRHAQSLFNIHATDELNSELSSDGFVQVLTLGDWLQHEFDLTDYKGLVSPFLRTLQTAFCLNQITGLQFTVEPAVREYHVDKSHPQLEDGAMFVSCEQVGYPEFEWPEEKAFSTGWSFKNESLEEFVDRIRNFYEGLEDGKYLIVSHGAPCRVLHDVAAGLDLSYLEERYDVKNVNEPKKESIPNASMTWIIDGKVEYASKVVY